MIEETLALLSAYSAAGTPCVLATVVRVEPPASAHPGDKAVITGDGRLQGWIGGSCSEPLVKREALRALAEGTPRLVSIIGDSAAPLERRAHGQLTMATTCPSGGSLDIFLEPRLPKPLLVVFGGSPAARTLVELGSLTGFRTCAVHPGARTEDFPRADLVLGELDLSRAGPAVEGWSVVASMGHYDEDAIEAALAIPGMQVMLVASARRAAAVRGILRDRGVDEAALKRIRTATRRVRGATQQEIAVLTVAELVTARRGLPAAGAPAVESQPRFATDPVCGMTVELPALHSGTVDGKEYAFCSAGCRDSFLATAASEASVFPMPS